MIGGRPLRVHTLLDRLGAEIATLRRLAKILHTRADNLQGFREALAGAARADEE